MRFPGPIPLFRTWRLVGFIVLAGLLALGGFTLGRAGDAAPVPVGAILRDLGWPPVKRSELLAFTSREDTRPWYVDDALLLVEETKGSWVLVHAVRNPRFPRGHQGGSALTRWGLYYVTDSPPVAERRFPQRPKAEEVEAFLKDNLWQAVSDRGWQVVRCDVDAALWQRVLGYPPVAGVTGAKSTARPASASASKKTPPTAK